MSSAVQTVRLKPVRTGRHGRNIRLAPNRSWLPTMSTAALAIVVFVFARTTLVDDAYITLSYARNVAFHLHWGLVPTATANTATSVFNVWVLALFTAITRRPVLALGIVYVLSTLALEYGLRRVARAVGLPTWFALLAAAIVALDPLLMSSIGLEVALGGGLIALLLASAVEDQPVRFGVLAGLLLLTRPDLVIVVIVVFLLVRRPWRKRWWWAPFAAIVVTAPWYVWSWFNLGSAVPITLFIKKGQRTWQAFGHDYGFGTGPELYLKVFPAATVLSFLPAVLGVLGALIWLVLRVFRATERVRRLDRVAPLALAGVLHYLAYSMLGVPPYHWYYGPSIICTAIFLAAAVAAIATPAMTTPTRQTRGAPRARLVPAALVVLLTVACAVHYGEHGLPPRFAPIQTNWASPEQYAEIGAKVAAVAGNRVVASSGEIGAEAYFCGCAMSDLFSDPAAAATLIPPVIAKSGPLTRTLLGWNFHYLGTTQPPMKPALALEFMHSPPTVPVIAFWHVDSPWLPGPGPGPNYIALVVAPSS